MPIDPVLALVTLGYTEREAAFLCLVAVHSGYFLRRQFNAFIARRKGHLAHRFLEKARVAGHVEIIDYGQGRFVYHLFSKTIYRLLGSLDSQNRRRKGDAQIRARLMALDYVLENPGEHFLATGEERRNFFLKTRGVPLHLLTGPDGRLNAFLTDFPVSVADPSHPATSPVLFPFMDEGLLTSRKFERFLAELAPFMCAVGTFEIVYTALTGLQFDDADRLFQRTFAAAGAGRQQILGDFRSMPSVLPATSRAPLRASFTTLLFSYPYPPLLRNERRESVPGSAANAPIGQ